MCVQRTARHSGPMSAPAPRGGRPGAARPTPLRRRVVVCVQSPGNTLARNFFVSKIQLRPRRAPRAFATFRLATIYLPQCLLFKWVVVKHSGVPLPVAGGDTHRSKFSLFCNSKPEFWKRLAWKLVSVPCDPATFVSLQICQHRARRRRSHTFLGGISHNCPFGHANCKLCHTARARDLRTQKTVRVDGGGMPWDGRDPHEKSMLPTHIPSCLFQYQIRRRPCPVCVVQ